ncbi:hypothetical protein [Variovorax sp. IB41]|uniref:hypothetical protein n=1 Tax=Variovorax sp. IB41 TaxID=2779370 RepID=UPI0018E7EE1A|nr:hypothetical protein [Variovorax sp. IB41]MBJ2159293.1 hypothetical protein [Variovorax sp. IB41]
MASAPPGASGFRLMWGLSETRRLASGALIDTSRRLLLGEAAQQEQTEILTSSPYFMPSPAALEGMRRNAGQGDGQRARSSPWMRFKLQWQSLLIPESML